jgi:hypothetical protein
MLFTDGTKSVVATGGSSTTQFALPQRKVEELESPPPQATNMKIPLIAARYRSK